MLWFCRSKNLNQHADVVDIKFFAVKNGLTVKLSMSNSMKVKTTFLGEYTTYKTLTERVNTFVVILTNDYKIKFIARSIQWCSSFPSSLQKFFTVTNSKDCPTIDGEKIQLNATPFIELLYRMCQCLRSHFCRSTTGGLQISLPTGLSRQACRDKL